MEDKLLTSDTIGTKKVEYYLIGNEQKQSIRIIVKEDSSFWGRNYPILESFGEFLDIREEVAAELNADS